MPKSKVLIIIPAYNEQESIKKTVTKVQKTGYDFVIINDGSTDNTKRILTDNNYPFIDLPFNLGIGGAMQTGYKYAHQKNYDIAIQFDADGQHNKSYLKDIINLIHKNDGICFLAHPFEYRINEPEQFINSIYDYCGYVADAKED